MTCGWRDLGGCFFFFAFWGEKKEVYLEPLLLIFCFGEEEKSVIKSCGEVVIFFFLFGEKKGESLSSVFILVLLFGRLLPFVKKFKNKTIETKASRFFQVAID